ncbi:EamA family transporter [Methanofollis fontis]|uniref:EamA domain-containing protein n=1 Tax=Methanofollis fontis TaxID=2052832 RepID=A0A483CP06_9EURY|nr:DMT family transporter [Methanofollis fontis]TAJ44445.1 hypothetical protein CUJ86_03740 [Methanofollis fontis]
MLWTALALTGALFNALYYITAKHWLRRCPEPLLAGSAFLCAGLILLLIAAITHLPLPGPEILPVLTVSAILNTAAVRLTFRALATTDISLAIPFLSFTPLFLVLTSWLILGERPGAGGMAGILLIVAGSYLLGGSGGISAPFHALSSHPGAALMLCVAAIYSITANVDKILLINAGLFVGYGIDLLCIGCFLLIFAAFDRSSLHGCGVLPPLVLGGLLAIEIMAIGSALLIQIVPYVISVKRTSILFAVLLGGALFREGERLRRGLSAGMMVAGAACILLMP